MVSAIISQILLYITDFSKFLHKFAGSASLPDVHYSILIVAFFLFVFFLAGLNLGKSRALLALISIYAAGFLEARFFDLNLIGQWMPSVPGYVLRFGVFLVFYALSFVVLNNSALKSRLTIKESSVFAVALITVCEIGLLGSIVISFLPPDRLDLLPRVLTNFLGNTIAQFFWAIVPLAAAVLLKSGSSKKGVSAEA